MSEDSERGRDRARLGRLLAAGAVGLVLMAVVAAGPAGTMPDCANGDIVDLELAGTLDRAAYVLQGCDDAALDEINGALLADSLLLVPLYAVTLALLALAAWRYAPPRTRAARGLLLSGAVAAVLAGLLDLVENAALWRLVDNGGASPGAAALAMAAALPKWALWFFAFAAGLTGLAQGVRRLRAGTPRAGSTLHPTPGAATTAWERAAAVPGADPGKVGVALSGGGIRSASFCMGALQVLSEERRPGDERPILRRARWLSAVSGGGYLAGARQLLASQGVDDPFSAGSAEVDHVRRHGRYLGDSTFEWLVNGSRVVIGLVLNLGVLWLLLYLAARPVGWLHANLFARSADGEIDVALTAGMWGAVALPAAVAALLAILAVFLRPKADTSVPPWGAGLLWWGAGMAGLAAVACFVVTVLAPVVSDAVDALLRLGEGEARAREVAAAGGGTIITGLLTLARMKAPSRKTLERWLRRGGGGEGSGGADEPSGPRPARFPRLGRIVRAAAGLGLAVIVVVLFAGLAQDAARVGIRGDIEILRTVEVPEWAATAAVAAVLLALFAFVDQTTWSLHPLYKRRLATAFALRHSDRDGRADELPYDQPTELSTLAPEGQPELVLCAAANTSGPDLAPPGRRAVTFTFTRDWIGGPQVGYVPSATLADALAPANRGDVTLLAAMALSGAAFASAMGRHSKGGLNSLLAVANLRLGAWLPSPRYADEVARGAARRAGTRRFTYLLREIVGRYDPDAPFLYVSDGGHYDNLGLVELLRRRCRVVFCCDASGGPGTLEESVRLAYEELGVVVRFPPREIESVRTVAESGEKPDDRGPPGGEGAGFDALLARMAEECVLVGTITYPDDTPPGVLVYGRAVLTPEAPELVLSYARDHLRFPNDPTGDQWFDIEQFNHYLLLGRQVGAQMVEALPEDVTPA